MPLPAHQLEAFHAVAETGGFSRAAKRLGVTQPALSQRIHQLEGELKHRLFVRSPAGITVTDAGARLLRYCEVTRALESEVLDDLAVEEHASGGRTPELSGTIRIAAFSSVGRSCVLRALAPLVHRNPRMTIELAVREMGELESILARGSAELVVLDHGVARPDVNHVALGFEELVMIEHRSVRARDDVYLDHDADDETTLRFLSRNGIKTRHVRRSFFSDIYGVLDAAAEGLGRAVVPKHLLLGDVTSAVRIVPNTKRARSPVVLHYFRQPSYTRTHEAVRKMLESSVPALLERRVPRLGR